MAASKKPPQTRSRRPSAPRRYAPARPAMQKMLDAAERVLARDGYQGFSTRRVAAECGVSPGHLTYYFPNKSTLLRAMISSLMARYGERIRSDSAAASTRSPQDLRAMLDWLLQDTVSAETNSVFRELWVLAKHDAVAARELLEFYEGLMESFVEVASVVYPGAGRRRLQQIARVIGMLTEGGTVLFAGPGERSVSFDEMRPVIIELIMDQLASTAGAYAS
jgi:AcrR family transcriptional regulator